MSNKSPDTPSATVHALPTLPGQADRLLLLTPDGMVED